MKAIESQALIDQLNWRYATKQFDPTKKIDPETWSVLEQTLVLAPSSFGLQPWKFLVIENPAKRQELLALSWGQKQVVDASHFLVFTVKHPLTAEDVRRFIVRTAEVRGTTVEEHAGYEKVIAGFIDKPAYPLDIREWSSRQLYLAFGGFMTAAALLGVDTCPMEGLNPAAYDKTLGLEGSGYFTVAACAAGYRHDDDKHASLPKVRYKHEEVINHIV
jgi:nitroreductase